MQPTDRTAHPNVERVVRAARAAGVEIVVQRFPQGARTAEDAAAAVGCEVGQIVKSLVFVADDRPVIALVSGTNRLDTSRLAATLGATAVRRADGNEARAATGYAIGGVPPFGYGRALEVVMDRDLAGWDHVWAAAGLPDVVFEITPADLERTSRARVADVAERRPG